MKTALSNFHYIDEKEIRTFPLYYRKIRLAETLQRTITVSHISDLNLHQVGLFEKKCFVFGGNLTRKYNNLKKWKISPTDA